MNRGKNDRTIMNSGKSRRFLFALLLIFSAISVIFSAQPKAAANPIPFMDLRITIDPQTQSLEASATISELSSAAEQVFFLNKNFKIRSVTAEGKPIEYTFDLDGKGVVILGEISAGLPQFTIPVFDTDLMQEISGLALTLALIGFMEAISIAKSIESKHNSYRVDANK